MAKFGETLKLVQDGLKKLMTEEGISDERLEELTELNAQVTELDKQHQGLEENYAKVRDKYIQSITEYGTSKKPDEVDGQPRTLEEIAAEVLAKK